MNASTNGVTLQQFIGATEAEIAATMTKSALESAAKKDSSALGSWAARAGDGARTELAGHAVGFLHGDAGDIVAGVWSRCAALKTSAEETKGKTGVTELVALADHNFTYSVEPQVDVVLDGVSLGSFKFTIQLTCVVKALELQVKDGAIAGLRSGECEGDATILLAGTTFWQKPLGHIDLSGTLRWKHPVVIA